MYKWNLNNEDYTGLIFSKMMTFDFTFTEEDTGRIDKSETYWEDKGDLAFTTTLELPNTEEPFILILRNETNVQIFDNCRFNYKKFLNKYPVDSIYQVTRDDIGKDISIRFERKTTVSKEKYREGLIDKLVG